MQPNQRLAAERHPDRDSEHTAIALVARREKGGESLRLPEEEGFFEPLHAGAVLKAAPAEAALGADDPNWGIVRRRCAPARRLSITWQVMTKPR